MRKTASKSLSPRYVLVARVRRFIVERQLVRPDDRVLVAVSGGPDSTALLLLLAALRRSLQIELQAAYFDHMLRGRRAIEREQRFLRTLCARLNVPLHTEAGDARARRTKTRTSLEEAARELRYDFLSRTASANHCTSVATGHTQDDQAETVLMHIIRGAGLRGLAGMAPSAPMPVRRANAPRLIRPLLGLSRADTKRCCREAGVEPLEDSTNRSRAHLRNRVRHELLPLLRRYNPRIEHSLVRLSAGAAADAESMAALAGAALADIKSKDGLLRLPRRSVEELPQGLRAHVVRAAIERLLGTVRSFSERHVIAILRAAGTTGSALDLPRALRVEVQRDAIVLRVGTPARAAPSRRVRLAVPGTARFGPWRLDAKSLDGAPTRLAPANGTATALLDAEAVGSGLWLRARRAGDRYRPLGLGHEKKLQDILVDAHVPRSERDTLPLLCSNNGIAWVVGQAPAEWAKVTSRTRHAVRVQAKRA